MKYIWPPFFIGAALALFGCGDGPESLNAKHEFSLLEVAVASNSSLVKSEIISKDGYDYLVIPGGNQNTWIMLKPRYQPYYKQMPTGEYLISKELFREVQASGLASPTVLSCLSSHVSN